MTESPLLEVVEAAKAALDDPFLSNAAGWHTSLQALRAALSALAQKEERSS